MDVLRAAKEEIALSGLEGCTVNELKFYLGIRNPSLENVDEVTESYLWHRLLLDKEISLQVLPEERVQFPLMGRSLQIDEDYDPFPLVHEAVVEGGLRGSCRRFEQRKDVTSKLRETLLTLVEVEEKYSNRLVLVGSQVLRENILVPSDVDPTVLEMDPLLYCVLEVVGQFRQYGVFRPQLYRHYFQIKDARRVWHMVARLVGMSLLIVKEVHPSKLTKRGNHFPHHRVFLARYTNCRVVHELCDVQRMKSEDTILEEDEIDEDSETVLTEPTPLIRELPLNCQIYNWIDSFGPSGVTTVMFTKQGPKLPHRMVKLFIKQSASMPVYAVTTQDWTITKTMKIISRKALCSHGNNDPQQQAIIQDILTGRQAKRKQMILNLFEESGTSVIPGEQAFRQCIFDAEKKEGRTTRIEKKTVMRLLGELITSGQIKTLHISPSTHPGVLKPETLFFLSTTSEEEVASHVQCFAEYRLKKKLPASCMENLDEKGEEERFDEPEDDVTWEQVCPNGQPEDLFLTQIVNPKFQRLQQMHLYMWCLTFGLHGNTDLNVDSLPVELFPWLQIPPESWPPPTPLGLLLDDIIGNMPLILVSMVIGTIKLKTSSVLPSVYKYINDPANRLVLFKDLPRKVRKDLTKLNKDYNRLSSGVVKCLALLKSMNLVHFDMERGKSFKSLVFVHVLPAGEFLDTSKCTQRKSFFTNEARSMFPVVRVPLNSPMDVAHFWSHLRETCLLTQIMLTARSRTSVSVCEDEHQLVYDGTTRDHNMGSFDLRGFGAGGLAPSMFSHVARNWGTFLPTKHTHLLGREESNGGQIKVVNVPKEMVAMRQGGRGLKRPSRSEPRDDNTPKPKKRAIKQNAKSTKVMDPPARDQIETLPHGLVELHERVDLEDPTSISMSAPMVCTLSSEADRDHSLLLDIVYNILLSDFSSSTAYKAHEILLSFPQDRLATVFKWLKQRFLLKDKKRSRLPHHRARKYDIASSVRDKLFGNFPREEEEDLWCRKLLRTNHKLITSHLGSSENHGVTGVTGGTDVTGVTDVTGGMDVTGVTGVTGGTDVTDPMDFSTDSGSMLPVVMATVASMCGDTERVLLDTLNFALPSHFINDYENACHRVPNYGNNCDDVIEEGDVEEDGEGESSDEGDPDRRRDPSSLLYIPETLAINPSEIHTTPSVQIGTILDPLSDQTPPTHTDKYLSVANESPQIQPELVVGPPLSGEVVGPPLSGEVVGPPLSGEVVGPPLSGEAVGPPLSDEEYTQAVCSYLHHSESDCKLALKIVGVVKEAGPVGTELSRVEEIILQDPTSTRPSVDIVQTLLNLNMVHNVGTTEGRLVHRDHVGGWYKVWSDVDKKEPNGPLIPFLKMSLLCHLTSNPGITWPALKDHYCQALQPRALELLLKVLIEDGCVSAHQLVGHTSSDVFATPNLGVVRTADLESAGFDKSTYFEASVNADILSYELSSSTL